MDLDRPATRATSSARARNLRRSQIDRNELTSPAAPAMGAYGHTRLREAVLGGATRDMLQQSPLPLLMAH